MARGARLNAVLLALALLPLRNALAHGTGALSLSSKQSSPGSSITIFGTEFAHNTSVRLELRGVLASVVFDRVKTSANGTFRQIVAIPADSRPGQYSIVAVGPDGDVAAQATIMIFPASSTVGGQPGMRDMPGMQGTGGPHATAEMMDVPITITAWGKGVIAVIVAASAVTGLLLLRSGRRRTR